MKQSSFFRIPLNIGAALVLVFAASAQNAPNPDNHGIVVANMEPSVKPGNNFYDYCNGAWLKRTEIPGDRAAVGVFTTLADISNKNTAALIEEVAKSKAAANSGPRKIADLYNSFMDESAIESRGLAPLKPHLAAIAAIRDKKELARVLGEGLRADVDPLNNTNFHTANIFGLWIAPDFNDSAHYTVYLLQGGLQLPDREYYLSDSEHMRSLRTQYQAHVSAMFKLAGFNDPDGRAKRVFDLEHAIAEKHWNLDDDQDIHKVNNPWKRSDFSAKAPGLDWDEYFAAAGLGQQANFIVWQPSAFTGEAALVDSTPLDSWKDLLSYHLIENFAAVLPKPMADEHFNFFGKILLGTPEQRPRWQRGVAVVNADLGDEVGKIYAQRYFPPEAKQRAQKMVANIVAAFHKRIDALSWMAPATKAEAQAKLNNLYVGIGYPETWHDYSGLEIKPDDIFGNQWRQETFHYHQQISRIGKDVDRHEWSMTPQTVNAVNLPLQNALNFPAAILQPPFFDKDAPDAVNYGAIGSIIGHEVSHTFDSEGSTFDAKGQLRDWWTPSDLKHFQAATAKLAAQYDQYHPFPDLALHGKQTLAENIADLGGIAASYDAYLEALNGKSAPLQDGFSGSQQFFIAFGQAHKSKIREAALRRQVMTDPHSPSEYRTDTVRNIDAWYKDFEVQPGETLYLAPEDRVRIW
ncbi:MAG TPA: M13 family metallopeptidase [Bryobacteraceae bacterium]|nr:M13 family metallopeptidase [Bryobacteraceae bacterium]